MAYAVVISLPDISQEELGDIAPLGMRSIHFQPSSEGSKIHAILRLQDDLPQFVAVSVSA
jgi:hypothetical protein